MGHARSVLRRAIGIEAQRDHIRFDVKADRIVFDEQGGIGLVGGAKALKGRGSILIGLEQIAYGRLAYLDELQGSSQPGEPQHQSQSAS